MNSLLSILHKNPALASVIVYNRFLREFGCQSVLPFRYEWSMQTSRVGRNAEEFNKNYDGNIPSNEWGWPLSWRRQQFNGYVFSIF